MEEVIIKEYKLFDFLKAMTQGKENLDFTNTSIKSNYSPYIIDKAVSMVNIFLPVANGMNKCKNLPKATHYEFYKSVLPKKNIQFKFIKKSKENDIAIECIANYYEISIREAKSYLFMLSEDQVNQIVAKYNYGKGK